MQSDKDEETLILGSLLHDLGKVRVRHDFSKNHPEHGFDMVNDLLRNSPSQYLMGRVANLVKYHHTQPNKTTLDPKDMELLEILKNADRKSAAHEREDRDSPPPKDGPYLERMTSYVSLFDEEKVEKAGEKQDEAQRKTFYVNSEADILKHEEKSSGYKSLDHNMMDELVKLHSDNFHTYLDSINSTLRNYTSVIPSAFYYSKQNIPLFDHLKITAAIAMALYRSKIENNTKFMLIRTDLSGIQDYIFRYYKSEQADDRGTKRIRGRSIRVGLTTRAITQHIVDSLNLYDVNVIWLNADGSLILAPYSEENEKLMERVRSEVEKYLSLHDRGITCAIEWKSEDYEIIPEAKDEKIETNGNIKVEDSKFRGFINELMDLVSVRKRQVSKSMIEKESSSFFQEWEGYPCETCGLNVSKHEGKCAECIAEEEIGTKIVRDEFDVIMDRDSNGDICFDFGDTKYSFTFDQKPVNDNQRVIYVNHYPERITFDSPWEIFLVGNNVPKSAGKIIPINDMLKIEGKEKVDGSMERENFYLGIFKADIDNMGLLISEGLPQLTLPSYASFSRQITLFFTNEVNRIAEKHSIYIIFSGGDDISALGPIDKIIEFAGELREEFTKWTGREEITFSCGIATTRAKFPIRRGIDIAEDAMENSKRNCYKKQKKNSITVFQTTMNWKEFKEMDKIQEMLKKSHSRLGRGFFHMIINMDQFNPYKKNIARGQDIVFPDHYLNYYIKRNWNGNDVEMINFLKEIVKPDVYKHIRFPVTYQIMLERR
jgi:CRISPR-associated protein Csm1